MIQSDPRHGTASRHEDRTAGIYEKLESGSSISELTNGPSYHGKMSFYRPCSKTWQVCLMTRDLSKVFRSHAALLSSSHTAFLCLWSQRLWCINIKSNFRGLLGDVFCSVCRSSSWHNRSTDLRRLTPMSSFWTNNDPAFLAADSYAHVMEGF